MSDGRAFGNALARGSLRGALLLVSISLSIVLFEVLLQTLARFGAITSFSSMYANTLPDEILGHRLPARIYAEIDSRGFRNPSVPEQVDVVAIGDSQTYGYNANSSESWPKRLEALSGKRVYNMGIGGYGPAQYSALIDDALAMSPRHIVIGFYLGNDVVDSCRVFGVPYWRERSNALSLDVSDCVIEEFLPAPPAGFRNRLRYSETFMLLKQVPILRDWLLVRRDREVARSQPTDFYTVDRGPLSTVITLQRYEAVRSDSPEVTRGLELTWRFLSSIFEQIGETHLTVLLIPTKANVLFEYLLDHGHDLPEKFHALVKDERNLTSDFRRRLESRGAAVVDARPALQQAVNEEERVFVEYRDGHPTPKGYDRMARALRDHLFADN